MASVIATEYYTIPVLFENDDIIAVDKPEKLASIPERNREKISLLKVLTETLQRKLYVVHRLDKQVSGVILFAKNPQAHRYLNILFEHRQVSKTYIALVHGVIEDASGVIDTPLRRFGSGRMGADAERGKPCRTEFTVEERLPGYTLVWVNPLTGRKHQIRAHFFSIGHPIVGDTLYGDKPLQKTFPRLMLHALSICLSLPTGESTKKELSVVFKSLFNHGSWLKYCIMLKPEKSPTPDANGGTHSWPLVQVLNSMTNHVVVLDDQHKVIFLNQAVCQSLGTTVAEAAGTTVYDYFPQRQAEIAWEHEQNALDSMRPSTRVGDGFLRVKFAESVTMLPFLDPGTSQKRLLVIVNSSPQKAHPLPMVKPGTAEHVPGPPPSDYLPDLNELIARATPIGIFLKNADNRYLWVNQAFGEMYGFEPGELVGTRVEDLIPDPELMPALRRDDAFVYSTGKPIFHRMIPRFYNQPGYYRVDKIPFINSSGELVGIIGLIVEVDDLQPPIDALKEELSSTSKKLQETETALRVLIERREQDVSLSREALNTKVKDLLVPYLEHLKQTQLKPEQAEFVDLIETNLKNFYDPAYARLSSPSCKLSPTELKVAQLIRDGKTNKEIAKLLHLSKSTILTHRHHVRVKLGIRNKKVNLRSLLSS